MTLVIHKKDAHLYDNVVLIDRTTKWGNPFKLSDNDNDRVEVLKKFENYVLTNPELCDMVIKELSGKTLACWCKPKLCHGDIYTRIINEHKLFGDIS